MAELTMHFADRILPLTLRFPLFIEKPCASKTQGSILENSDERFLPLYI